MSFHPFVDDLAAGFDVDGVAGLAAFSVDAGLEEPSPEAAGPRGSCPNPNSPFRTFRRGVARRGLVRPTRPAVRLVEAAPLEDDPDIAEDLPHRGPTGGAGRQWIILERLNDIEVLLAAVAAILVGGQPGSPLDPKPASGWQST